MIICCLIFKSDISDIYVFFICILTHEIEIDQFSILTEEDLKSLIPSIGPQRKFQSIVKQYFSNKRQKFVYILHFLYISLLRQFISINKISINVW